MKKPILSIALAVSLAGTLFADSTPAETIVPAEKIAATEPGSDAATEAQKTSTPAGWLDDFAEAKKLAKKENKLLLVDFSGSDWCSWCKRLDEEVFSKPEFLEAAKKSFVLVFIDTPHDQSLLSEQAKKQNPKLLEQFKIEGFPTVLILNADGKRLAETGYRSGGVENYLKSLAEVTDFSKKISSIKSGLKGLERGTAKRVKKIHEAIKNFTLEQQRENEDLANLANEVVAYNGEGSEELHAQYSYFAFVKPFQDKYFVPLTKKLNEKIEAALQGKEDLGPEAKEAVRKKVAEILKESLPQIIECRDKLLEIVKKIPKEQTEALEIVTSMATQLEYIIKAATEDDKPADNKADDSNGGGDNEKAAEPVFDDDNAASYEAEEEVSDEEFFSEDF